MYKCDQEVTYIYQIKVHINIFATFFKVRSIAKTAIMYDNLMKTKPNGLRSLISISFQVAKYGNGILLYFVKVSYNRNDQTKALIRR